MTAAIKARVVRIGNSRGIRIPKPMLEQLGIEDEVMLSIEGDHLRIHPKRNVREGWAEQFAAMAANGDDKLIHGEPLPTKFDEEEWEW